MKILLLKNNMIRSFNLPEKVIGSIWITSFDENGNEKNILNVNSNNGEWELISNNDYYIIEDSKKIAYSKLEKNKFYLIKEAQSDNVFYVTSDVTYDNSINYFQASTPLVTGITVGSKKDNTIVFDSPYMSPVHANFILKDNEIVVEDKSNNYGIYLNNKKVLNKATVKYGDVVYLMGLKILFIRYEGSLVIGISNPNNNVKTILESIKIVKQSDKFDEKEEEKDMVLYSDDDYFYKKPRFIYTVEPLEIKIDPPPTKSSKQDIPLIITIGPMATMSVTSMVMIYNTINNITYGDSTWEESMPSLIASGAMMLSFLLWPLVTNLFQKHQEKKKERNRQTKYSEYIESKKRMITDEKVNQEEILRKRFPSITECADIIVKKDDRLWEKRVEDNDFFSVSLGKGSFPMRVNITFPEERFTVEEDNLKNKVKELETEDKSLNDVPIPFSFSENYLSAIIGKEILGIRLIKNMITQLMESHSYDNLKIVIFTSKEKENNWENIKFLPHLFSNDKNIRYFASDNDEYKEVMYSLERIYNHRKDNYKENSYQKEIYNPVYLIITDSFNSIRNYDFINNIVDSKINIGFSMLILNDKISSLPDNCQTFIELDTNECSMFKNMANNEKQKFVMEKPIDNFKDCVKRLSNIPIEINDDQEVAIPKKVGFLEMYNVGKVEQLNSINRWVENVPINNMDALVGIGKNGEKVRLDLHEKFHGPHGLIAGMTGSGKSEFIITYILSMAVNYHPYEVQFVLIDYKGGGLAGAFENKSMGFKLPHLVGVITNLDKNEINRSLASIESELKRRQALFNTAREKSGESTIDIYKYQKMYRNKIVDEPVSHLFIIADEFAELKTQQPEFMDQLISTARIGRSLGVHLILATQKPSGVVDSQIWSNTRFRVCFRVQEKSDSTEVIQCPDAAYLTQTGRFYMQVGFNEIFLLGQSAWAGGKYIPSESIIRTLDTSINFINNNGYIIKNIETKKDDSFKESKGEELINIVQYLCECAKEEKIYTNPLWLEKMPGYIPVTDLVNKYNYKKEKYMINPIVGEYDVPNMQEQHLLTVPFYKEGNVIIYGMSGSGKENFLTTMIYSSMLAYSPEEINYYIFDFGAEILRYFEDSPIVGDIVYIDESEKVKNLFKMITDEIEKRKKIFAEFNGSYQGYIKHSDKGLQNIVIVINNYEAYAETYSDYEDILINLTRDCVKYGIYFVFTCNTAEGIRFKIKQNFGQVFVLQQNNEDDYISILGNVNKTYPSKTFGRGIIKKDSEVFEFQTSFVGPRESISDYVKLLSMKIKSLYETKAKKIPILPERVVYDYIEDIKDPSINNFVIGIGKNELEPIYFDFTKNHVNAITTNDNSLLDVFINPFIGQCTLYNSEVNTIVINADEYTVSDDIKEKVNYVDNNFDKIFTDTINYLVECENRYKQNNFNNEIFKDDKYLNVVILGINSLKRKLNPDNQAKFSELFTTASELLISSFIIIDSVDKIKNFEFEPWFKSLFNKNDAIWLGGGFADQYFINVSKRIPEAKEDVPSNFCFVVNRGKPCYVKYIEDVKNE